jgi:hypothetical protein
MGRTRRPDSNRQPWPRAVSIRRPPGYEPGALPAELRGTAPRQGPGIPRVHLTERLPAAHGDRHSSPAQASNPGHTASRLPRDVIFRASGPLLHGRRGSATELAGSQHTRVPLGPGTAASPPAALGRSPTGAGRFGVQVLRRGSRAPSSGGNSRLSLPPASANRAAKSSSYRRETPPPCALAGTHGGRRRGPPASAPPSRFFRPRGGVSGQISAVRMASSVEPP